MHSESTVRRALELDARGANATVIARMLDVPRETVRDWLRGAVPRFDRGGCCVCAGQLDELPPSYVYLLGLYLGDGCISRHPRAVYRLRIVLDTKYPLIIGAAERAMREVRNGTVSVHRRQENCVDVSSYWKHWPCAFPQVGAGPKHERPIELTEWQQALIAGFPELLLRGLIHSDGYRFINTGRCGWSCPRYAFSQVSTDIQDIFCMACDRLGLHWTRSGKRTIYVSRKKDVERLDTFIGAKA